MQQFEKLFNMISPPSTTEAETVLIDFQMELDDL